MKKILLTFLGLSIVPTGAFAATLSFDEIRLACQNPSKFHNQIAPTNLQISCRDVQTKWVPTTEGSLEMPNSRQVTGSVSSDKYNSVATSGSVSMPNQIATCPRYKEVSESLEAVRAMTCDELVAFTGSAVEFCTGVINSMRASNPDSIVTADTGQVVELCTQQVVPNKVEVKQPTEENAAPKETPEAPKDEEPADRGQH